MKNEELTKLIQTEPDPDKVIVALSQEVVHQQQQNKELLEVLKDLKARMEQNDPDFNLPSLNELLEKLEGFK